MEAGPCGVGGVVPQWVCGWVGWEGGGWGGCGGGEKGVGAVIGMGGAVWLGVVVGGGACGCRQVGGVGVVACGRGGRRSWVG
jgi:hypothetical protein